MPTLSINFTPVTPPPPQGYTLRYRRAGDVDYNTLYGFPSSPIVVYALPYDSYEGFLSAVCGPGAASQDIPFSFFAPPLPATVPCATVSDSFQTSVESSCVNSNGSENPIPSDPNQDPNLYKVEFRTITATIPNTFNQDMDVSCHFTHRDCSGSMTNATIIIRIPKGSLTGQSTYNARDYVNCTANNGGCAAVTMTYDFFTQFPTC